ncbi:MAG: HesA/MoeB/ThiF family protein [Nanoarchaeota archaeon]|nr:HesA/MoeB/ThiF family protein [Nanoarchaeota archaeon]
MPPERYARQLVLPEIGAEGQKKLAQAEVAIVGLGALGTVTAELLARAGVGKLILIDRDVVEESNLPRQFLYAEEDIGKSKARAAEERLRKINRSIGIEAEAIHLNTATSPFLKNADIIMDCTDNLSTRFFLNDFCKKESKRWIYAAAVKTAGYVMPLFPDGPCLRCFLKEKADVETCASAGVLNTATSIIASLQATLALKILLNHDVPPKLYFLDIWQLDLKTLTIQRQKNCPACQGTYPALEKKEEALLLRFCGEQKYQISGKKKDLALIKGRWEKIGAVHHEQKALHRENITLFADGRALIKARSAEEAFALYDQYVGN